MLLKHFAGSAFSVVACHINARPLCTFHGVNIVHTTFRLVFSFHPFRLFVLIIEFVLPRFITPRRLFIPSHSLAFIPPLFVLAHAFRKTFESFSSFPRTLTTSRCSRYHRCLKAAFYPSSCPYFPYPVASSGSTL